MKYYDEEILEAKREIERNKHSTLEAGIYAGDELIEFTNISLLNSKIYLPMPKRFVIMPEVVKQTKYPSNNAPDFIMTSLDIVVNFAFNLLNVKDGNVKVMSLQFQNALKNVNPTIIIKNQIDTNTNQGNEMSWFDYKGFALDGQSYNRVCLIKMNKVVLHVIFNCRFRDKANWEMIIDQVFMAIEEK